MREFVVLGMGSNRGWNGLSPVELLHCACKELSKFLEDASFSSVYRTKPMYLECQNDFFNMVSVGFLENIEPQAFLDEIHRIEADYGRDRSLEIRNGPRSLDIDIEFFGERKINTKTLSVPHPRIAERAFVLVPLLEIFQKKSDLKRYGDFIGKFVSFDSKSIDSGGVEKISAFEEL